MTELENDYVTDEDTDVDIDTEDDLTATEEDEGDITYSLEDDIEELRSEYPELVSSVKNTNSERYGELRALGLTPREAYLATGEHKKPRDTRGHLGDSAPRTAKSPVTTMSRRELEIAHSIFDGMSDDEIKRLYNKVKS